MVAGAQLILSTEKSLMSLDVRTLEAVGTKRTRAQCALLHHSSLHAVHKTVG